jgi:hypothetical protein
MVLVSGPGRMAAHLLTRVLVLSPSSGAGSSWGRCTAPVQLFGGGHPGLEGAAARHPQDPEHLDLALAGLGRGGGHSGQGRPGGGLGIDRVRLAVSPPQAGVRPVDLDSLQPVGAHEPGQPSAVGAGAFDPDPLDRPEAFGPVTRATSPRVEAGNAWVPHGRPV